MGKELTIIEAGDASPILALRTPPAELQALIHENIGPDGIAVGDLDRVKVPAGGGTVWEVPSIDGDDAVKVIEGVVIERLTRRAYWQSAYSGANDPPDCRSDDGITGEGEPGGVCARCPLNEFGTATKQDGSEGLGKACAETRLLFVLQPDSLIPLVIKVPPGSLKPFRQYSMRLLKAQLSMTGVVTKIGLEKAQSGDGITFSKITFEAGDRLSDEAKAAMVAYGEVLRPVAAQVTVEREDVE